MPIIVAFKYAAITLKSPFRDSSEFLQLLEKRRKATIDFGVKNILLKCQENMPIKITTRSPQLAAPDFMATP